ncbi:hypothetical protein [Pseudoflavonifractor sp. MCC625]|uniref:hypothetical protein n=1 Tax=Pseudoflavonifractor sp. MCC625 TaxID=2592647 RepID=UPI001C0092EF|nr:hypothetical protein [Pseudoflavonifractor sp. MCC625]
MFALMSRAVNTSENVSETTRSEIQTFIKKVIQANINAKGYSEEEMVSRAQAFYSRMDGKEEPAYPLLKKYCGEFTALATAMRMASANLTILEFLKKLIHAEAGKHNAFVKNYIDELIARANPMEKAVYDEIRYNELIIRYQGEVEVAKEKFAAEQTHDASELCLIAEIIDWVFTADEKEVNGQSRLNMFALTREIHEKAINNHTAAYRAIDKIHLPITIGEYTTTADFSNEASEQQKVEQFFAAKRDNSLTQVKNWPAYVGFALGIAAAIASPLTSLSLLVVTLIGAGFGVVTLLKNKADRKQILLDYDNSISMTMDVLRHLFEEYGTYLAEYYEYDRYTEQIAAEFAQL